MEQGDSFTMQPDRKEKISTRRTYLLLSRSLFQLLEEMPFEKITLTQLCDHSMVPRSTFYRYFEDKYDLLYYCLQIFFEHFDLDKDVIYLKDGKARTFVTKLIAAIYANKTVFQKTYQINKNGIFMDILRNYLVQVLDQKLHDLALENCRLNIKSSIFVYLLAELYISIAKCYLEAEEDYDMEEFVANVCAFANREFFA